MTIKYARLIEGSLLTGSIATYYTAPEMTKTVIKKLTFCNNTSDNASLTVHLVKAGDTAGNKNLLIDARQLASDETFDCFAALLHVLEPGDTIQAKSTVANAINIMASGIETK